MLWVDAQLSPALAEWITQFLGIPCMALRDLGLRDAKDLRIFHAAREQGAILVTKDADFTVIQAQLGAPPCIIWLTCGNTSNAALRGILGRALPKAVEWVRRGEILVEIRS